MVRRQFAVSTHLYHHQRLTRDHILEIAAHGFDAVEVFATRTHVDYHNPSVVADLQQWLAEAGLELHSVHAPVGADTPDDVDHALFIARRIPVQVFVMRTEGTRDTVRRSVERVADLAQPLGVKIAVEAGPDDASPPGSLVHLVEEDLEGEVGIGLDFAREQRRGDLIDAIETVSGHLMTTHVHDNRGRADDHLVPFEGTIDWPAAMTAIQKVGYDQTLMFEIAARGPATETLQKAQRARQRIERLLADD